MEKKIPQALPETQLEKEKNFHQYSLNKLETSVMESTQGSSFAIEIKGMKYLYQTAPPALLAK